MSNSLAHPYHLVDGSPWPLLSSFAAFGLTAGLVLWFYTGYIVLVLINLLGLTLVSFLWWRDISREGTLLGLHTSEVETGLRWGMTLFIISEVFFFVSFFWAYFYSSLCPDIELGMVWPPLGVTPFDPMGVPLLNTMVLLSSGFSVTWAHHSLMEGEHDHATFSLGVTLVLGVYFTGLQGMEYLEASFSIADSVYGSCFFIATGFHGLHVIVGSLLLSASLWRLTDGNFSPTHHFGFEAAAWYWHFVDVVWLFLYLSIYWWGTA